MWQKFTERARQVIFLAQEEAASLGSNAVDDEHLLLGLLRQEDSIAWALLGRTSVDVRKLRRSVKENIKRGPGLTKEDMQLTAQAKRVVDLSYDEARLLESKAIGTEHLLLGLLRHEEGPAFAALSKAGANILTIRQEISPVEMPREKKMDKTENLDVSMKGRDLISIRDLSGEDVWKIFRTARMLKSRTLQQQVDNPILAGKTLAMIFEKPSLRTRVTFEAGMTQLGGHAIYLQPADIQMGKRESVADTAKNLERWVDGIMARTFAHKTVVGLAKYSKVPVINGLSDLEHPCQALADFFTVYEKKENLTGLKFAYIGDGCNTCHSLMLLAAKVGANMTVGCPEGYEPDTVILTSAKRDAKETDASISITNDPFEAVKDADVIYTDVWTSMGIEEEAEKRRPIFQPFQVNQALVDAAKDDVIVMHCLPAHRGEEITDEVMDGPNSVVFDEAENRLHVQKAVMALLM